MYMSYALFVKMDFIIPPRLANREIRRDYWDVLPIVDKNGNKAYIPCHYIDV